MMSEPDFPALSDAAMAVVRLNWSEAYRRLTARGPGNEAARQLLEPLTPETVLRQPPRSIAAARCVLAGLWLWHDWLDRSHSISQQTHTIEGSYWHAIMHRREGDFWNSRYWLDRCHGHPALVPMGAGVTHLLTSHRSDKSLLQLSLGQFDCRGFVDLVEEIHQTPDDPRFPLAIEIQRLEWILLLQHCLAAAG
ncbi:MAG: hypothetical protein NZ561_03530 [Phycisphaerae bacterium]|nr:hypothetical protein [Phycisphaerae bacterium]MDW8263614.1 hypothetical protein [Phycisphaerales bacterium]